MIEFLFYLSLYLLIGYGLSAWTVKRIKNDIDKVPITQKDYDTQSEIRSMTNMFGEDGLVKAVYGLCMALWILLVPVIIYGLSKKLVLKLKQ